VLYEVCVDDGIETSRYKGRSGCEKAVRVSQIVVYRVVDVMVHVVVAPAIL
jgi:hypothetical protein